MKTASIYACRFTYYGKEIVITKRVTDSMEERRGWKAAYARDWMRQKIEQHTGCRGNRKCIQYVEITSQYIPLEKTFSDMDKAKADWQREHNIQE